jgi:hypothetical protein
VSRRNRNSDEVRGSRFEVGLVNRVEILHVIEHRQALQVSISRHTSPPPSCLQYLAREHKTEYDKLAEEIQG